jgi:hypothetical protein
MLIELITPIMLASAPMTVVLPESNYDHGSQVSTYKGGTKLALTLNGTQTYRFDGRPSDADSD